MRHLLFFFLILLAACRQQAGAPAPREETGTETARPAAKPQREPVAARQDGAAAETLRRYYALLEKGDYAGAYALRGGSRIGRDRFAANFKAYESYHATIGTPSLPVTDGEWDYVEVPVMITGRFVGGRPFGSTGSVSLRRARTGPDRAWRIQAAG